MYRYQPEAEWPALFREFMSAPFPSKAATQPVWPFTTAMCSAQLPVAFWALMSMGRLQISPTAYVPESDIGSKKGRGFGNLSKANFASNVQRRLAFFIRNG